MSNYGSRARELVAAGLCSSDRVFELLDRARGSRSGGVILAFHDLPTDSFVEQVEALGKGRIVHLGEIVDRLASGRPTAGLYAITFDDGVGTVTRRVAEMAVGLTVPVTCYVPTGYLDNSDALAFQAWEAVRVRLPRIEIRLPSRVVDLRTHAARDSFVADMTQRLYTRPEANLLPLTHELAAFLVEHGHATKDELRPPAPISWDELTALSKNPLIRFESHGVSHRAMTALGADELEREVVLSQRAIEDRTNRRCRHFCYPYGSIESIGPRAPTIVRKHYDSAVTMVRGRVGHQKPELLPRVPLYGRDTGNVARLKAITA